MNAVPHSPSNTSYAQQSGTNYDYCILIRRTAYGRTSSYATTPIPGSITSANGVFVA